MATSEDSKKKSRSGEKREHRKRRREEGNTDEKTKVRKSSRSERASGSAAVKKKVQTISELVKLVIAGEVKVPQSLSHYVEDRAQLLDQVFTILSETDIRGMLPDILKGLKMRQVRQLCLDQLKTMSNEVILDCVEPQKPQESLNVDAAVLELLGPSNTASEENKTSSTVDNSDVGMVKVGGGESGVGGEQSGDVKESSDISGRELQSEEGSPTQTVECDTTTSDISREDAEHNSRGDSGKEDITSREDFDKDHTSRDREREEGHSSISKEGSGRRDSGKERGEIVKDGTSRGDTSRGDETREEDAMEEVAESEGESSSGSDLEDFWLCDFPEEVSEWARLQEIEFRRRALEAELRRRGEGGEGVKGMSVGGCEGDKVDKSEAIELQLRQRALQSLLAKKQELQK